MEGINTIEKYEKTLKNLESAHEEDQKAAWQILDQMVSEGASVCRAKIILKLAYDMLEVQSTVVASSNKSQT